ncbi:MAG TPA: proteasome subunit beta [Candidatus Nanoarchaeia archaeon]|nr:proteasome subunit beta [Candidatus Nanoarchaeia archaeon]
MEENRLKTGTTTVGIQCKDGIVLAADRRATAGYLIANKKAEKVFPLNERIAVTISGMVSDAQLLTKLMKAELKLKEMRADREVTVKEAANLLAGLIYGNVRRPSMIPGISHFLLGGTDSSGFHLYDLFADGSITEIDDFVASGSGSVIAYGVLETLYKKDLSVADGVDLAIKSVNAAMQRDIASGQGIDVVSITKDGVKKVFEQQIDYSIKVK